MAKHPAEDAISLELGHVSATTGRGCGAVSSECDRRGESEGGGRE